MDVTLREGNYTIDFNLKANQAAHIVDYLDHANIQYIEVATADPAASMKTSDLEYIQAAKEVSKKSKLGALLIPQSSDTSSIDYLLPHLDFIRIGLNIHEMSCAAPWVEKTKKQGLFTFFQLIRTTLLTPSKAALAAKKAEKMGADVVYIVDTMGSLTPQKVKEYVKAIKDKVNVPIGFHAHNNLGLAIANSLQAVESGCEWIDASLLGVGRQAGNTQFEAIVLLLQKEGYKISIDIPLLLETAELLAAPLFKNHKGIDSYDLWSAYWNIDLSPKWAYERMAIALGIDSKSLIKELAAFKNFVTLDESQLFTLSEKFNVPHDKLLDAINSPPNAIKTLY